MKILVLGASQGTGALTVKEALDRGHDVTAFARTPDRLDITHAKLTKTTALEPVPVEIARTDIAHFLVEAAEKDTWNGHTVQIGVASPEDTRLPTWESAHVAPSKTLAAFQGSSHWPGARARQARRSPAQRLAISRACAGEQSEPSHAPAALPCWAAQ